MPDNRLKGFTDEEIYVLKRAMLDSNFSAVCSKIYSENHKRTHKKLLQEFINEDTLRLVEKE